MRFNDYKKKVKIGSNAGKDLKRNLIHCLEALADVFAWSHEDMPRTEPNSEIETFKPREI